MDFHTKADYLPELDLDTSFDDMPTEDELKETVDNMKARGFVVDVVETGDEAVEGIKEVIPDGASIMNGHSTTLEQIGFIEYLQNEEVPWENLHEKVFSIDDDEAMRDARREAQTADYFLGSVNAIAQTGEMVSADASGSRTGAYPYAAKHVILVTGINKVMEDLDGALQRLEDFAYPLENERAKDAYGVGSAISKELVFRRERTEGRTHVILIKENLGF